MEDDKSELGTEQVADARKTYPIENARHNYAVENGNPQGMRFTAAMADKSAQRVSLKEGLQVGTWKKVCSKSQRNTGCQYDKNQFIKIFF